MRAGPARGEPAPRSRQTGKRRMAGGRVLSELADEAARAARVHVAAGVVGRGADRDHDRAVVARLGRGRGGRPHG